MSSWWTAQPDLVRVFVPGMTSWWFVPYLPCSVHLVLPNGWTAVQRRRQADTLIHLDPNTLRRRATHVFHSPDANAAAHRRWPLQQQHRIWPGVTARVPLAPPPDRKHGGSCADRHRATTDAKSHTQQRAAQQRTRRSTAARSATVQQRSSTLTYSSAHQRSVRQCGSAAVRAAPRSRSCRSPSRHQ